MRIIIIIITHHPTAEDRSFPGVPSRGIIISIID